ncbi:hypothetical protein MAR_007422 [Mya arenaria]|uniref:Uncharacterized protein n=1 Tax=Mya arenaria TaxID=6604 RepID=A0ABY7DB94_MYAAR|nr:hypothetical protein MAR_007422 [Mya arenaria]
MADIVSFSEKASAIRTISWSCDNRIAICTDEGIKSLILQCKVNNSANKPFFVQTDIPVNPDVWDIPKCLHNANC